MLGCCRSSAEEEEGWCEAAPEGASPLGPRLEVPFGRVFSGCLACCCSAELWQEREKGQLQGVVSCSGCISSLLQGLTENNMTYVTMVRILDSNIYAEQPDLQRKVSSFRALLT